MLLSLRVTLAALAVVVVGPLPGWAQLPPEDHEPYCEYRVIGDRVLLKNPNPTVALVPPVCKGHNGLGTTWWDDDVRLTYSDTSDALGSSLAVKETYLHITWMDDRINRLDKVFYKRSTDLGHTWEEDVVISNAPDEVRQSYPDIALSTSCLHAVWGYSWKPIGEQGHIYYRRSQDNGATWEDIYYLSSYEMQSKPSIATLGGTVYVVFTRTIEQHGNYIPELHFRKSCDEGATWTEARVIADYYPHLIRGVLRANEEGLHYVFQHEDNFDDPSNPYRSEEIFYIHSPDFGETWTDPLIVSHRDSIHSQWPSMCVDDQGPIHVSWFDYKFSPYSWTGDIFYTKSSEKSTDDGQMWTEIQVLTDAHTANWSNIIARGNHLYLVWEDQRNEWNNYDIFFRHSRDGGESWDIEERLTDVREDSYGPVIAEKGDSLYVVWSDKRNDPTNRREEIYFKRGGLEAISVEKPLATKRDLYLTCYPNPFNEKTLLRYGAPGDHGAQRVSVKIYNIRGQLVKTIVHSKLTPGQYQTVWDGRSHDNREVASGVYFCVLSSGEDVLKTKRIVLIR